MAGVEEVEQQQRTATWLWWQALSDRIRTWVDQAQPPELGLVLGTSLLVGLGTGVGSVVFRWLLSLISRLAFEVVPSLLGTGISTFYIILVPALGGLLVGPLTYFFAREAKGHGVPEVMQALALRGGRIRPIVALIKTVASAITIGTGGSAGQEGPIVQIGAALGSSVGQFLRLSNARIRNLVACGAAAGIAAVFNAPIGGVLFSVEVLLGELNVGNFANVVVASVAASVVSRAFFGSFPAFRVPPYTLVSSWELLFYAVLGVLAGLVAVVYIRVLYAFEDVFERWQAPEYLKPAVGGLGVGLIATMYPEVLGGGYDVIERVLHSEVILGTLLALLVLKLIATSLTLGSGGSGGVFAPGLFLGAVLGGIFGYVIHGWFPTITAPAGAYALVGMAAVFAGSAHAPMTAIVILFEMTGDYRIILPLMLTTVIGTLVSHRLHRESIYTLKLVRRGIRLAGGRDVDVMQSVRVEEVMSREVETVPADMPLTELAEHFARTHHHGFPVLDEKGELYGIVTIQDLNDAISRPDFHTLRVRDIATSPPVVAFPDETMWDALRKMAPRDLSRLPVVSRENPRRLVGLLRRRDIIKAYNVAMVRRLELQHHIEQVPPHHLAGAEFVEVEIAPDMWAAGKRVRDLPLPKQCILVSIRRDGQLLIPHGDTVIMPGDYVIALVQQGGMGAFQAALMDGKACLEVEKHQDKEVSA